MPHPDPRPTAPLFGFSPWRTGVRDAADLRGLAARADDAGLDVLTVPDHLHLGDKLDAYAALATVLATTTRLRAAVTVTNVALRPAPLLARTLTSLQALSGERVIFGVGAGGFPADDLRAGAPPRTARQAVQAMEEAITLTRRLAGGSQPVTAHVRSYSVDRLDPAPVAAPPVWTGSVGPRSLQVTGRLADGWIPGHAADWHSTRFRDSRAVVDRAATTAGRDPASIGTYFNVFGRITDTPSDPHDGEGRWWSGSPAQWVAELTAAAIDHAASGFLFHVADDADDTRTLMLWSEEIAPAVRENVVRATRRT